MIDVSQSLVRFPPQTEVQGRKADGLSPQTADPSLSRTAAVTGTGKPLDQPDKSVTANGADSQENQNLQTAPLEQAVESINDYLQANRRSLEFNLDDSTGTVVVTVTDKENNEVIRQIPPEYALKLMDQMRDGIGISDTGITEEA